MRLLKLMRSTVNVCILFSALVLAPVFAIAHFSLGLSTLIGDFADSFLPNPTVLNSERRANAVRSAETHKRVVAGRQVARKKSERVLVRGAATFAVGFVPFIGLAADAYSLVEDYGDVCDLLRVIDDLSAMLVISDGSLYQENYCHMPEQGMQKFKESAAEIDWSWESGGARTDASSVEQF